MMKKKPKMRNRYIMRSRECTLKSRKSAVARPFTDPYPPEARNEFVLPVFPIFHQDDQLVRSRDVVEYELLDTGVFDDERYWDVFVEVCLNPLSTAICIFIRPLI